MSDASMKNQHTLPDLSVGERVAGAHPNRNDYYWLGEVTAAYPDAGMALVEWFKGKNLPGCKCQYAITDLRRLPR